MPSRELVCFHSGIGGSMGDLRPLISLALAIRARGFDIMVRGDVIFERLAFAAGIRESEWFSTSQVPQTFWYRTTAGQRGLWGGRLRLRDHRLREEFRRHWRERTEMFWRAVGGPANSRIVAAVGAVPAVKGLCSFGPQCAKIVSSPQLAQPSREFTLIPSDLSRFERLREWWYARRVTDEDRRPFREELFHLVGLSPALFPRPSDWPPNMQITGYMPLDNAPADSAPEALRAFLAAGPPPVYVGFGQHAVLVGEDGARRAQAVVDGCRRAGVRCVLHSPDVRPALAADDVFVLNEQISYSWLYPRCAAVVHHGGYGSIHYALVARRPLVTYPFQVDQFLWARRLGELNVGPGFTCRLRDLTAGRLAADLRFALQPSCARNAARLGAAMAREDGIGVQVAAIESIIEHTRRGRRPLEWQMPELHAAEAAMT